MDSPTAEQLIRILKFLTTANNLLTIISQEELNSELLQPVKQLLIKH